MRKVLMVIAAIIIMTSATVFAADKNDEIVYKPTKVVLIGDVEFKTPDYYKIANKVIKSKVKGACEVGDDVQKDYQAFMIDRYNIGDNKPNKRDLIDFAASFGNVNVLYLVVDSTVDTQNNALDKQKNRISVQIDAYLVDNQDLLDSATTTQDSVSKTSNLRARRAAFEKSLKKVVKKIRFR